MAVKMSNPIVCVSVVQNAEIVMQPYAFQVDPSQTYSQLLEGLFLASAKDTLCTRFKRTIAVSDKTLIKCFVSSKTGSPIEVNLGINCKEGCDMFGGFVEFKLQDYKCEEPVEKVNAFDIMISASKTVLLEYPQKFGANPNECSRGDYRLRNDFIDLLRKHGMGFPNGLEKSVGKAITVGLCDMLFYILPHLAKICARSFTFPELFNCFLKNVEIFDQTYNMPEKHKNVARLDAETLDRKLQVLYDLKLKHSHSLSIPRYKKLYDALSEIVRGVQSYLDNLRCTNERQKMIHQSLQPIRSVNDGRSSHVKVIKGGIRKEREIKMYQEMEKALNEKENYEPIFINDLLPIHRKRRFDFVSSLKLPFDIELYTYHPGGRYESLYFGWKSSGTDPSKTNETIHKVESSGDLPIFHTRAMRKEFVSRFSLVSNLSPAIMTELYQFLTGDQSVMSSQISKDVHARLRLLLDTQDPDIVYDLRSNNEGRPESFNEFWVEMDKFLNEEAAKAVDDRRHGTICHSSIAMSVPDLRNLIKSRLPENVAIPSEKWLYLQFSPQNPYHKSAVHFSNRFNLKLKVQSRQFNVDHPDAHYAAAVFRYVKEFCVKHKEITVLLCVDDKAAIPIGEPGVPMATVARGKKTVMQGDVPFLVADHDTATKCKVVPSTILIPDIPDAVENGSFYRGTVCTILKDSIFQPSSPLRHSAEIRKMLGVTGNMNKSIRVIYSDGGPDHRVTYPSVQLSLVALFLLDDLDVLLAARCCPSRSYTNPAERWHSVMNLALQSVALERAKMEEQYEKVMQRCDTMKAIRDSGRKVKGFSEAVSESLSSVTETLYDLFSRLSLKDRPCVIGKPANDDLLEEMWISLSSLDETISRDDTTAKSLSGKKSYQDFIEHCTLRRQYFFMIKKCGKGDCKICKPVRGSRDEFDQIHFLPDPVPCPTNPDHYSEFKDVYGKNTSDEHRPSLQQKKVAIGSAAKSRGLRVSGETVRTVLHCEECNKPRCLYSNKKLTTAQSESLAKLEEEVAFVCGTNFIPDTHDLYQVCFILDGITCATEVSANYYSSRLNFRLVCHVCGLGESLRTITHEEKSQFQSIHPVCTTCFDKGYTERKRGEKKGQKRKK